ncbi:Non-specific serine/threonine protein kinase [Paenibacillus nuruki]|uniref:Non-specific serine/threonine protein kinase n=1 Tax=Paenibacillus nuruki TaxID=1886670 RepID=A0A1E3KZ56_9BACL|nr:protein kinase [Paenibacillus nuruki]ODP26621.1 Non-specific serine/threonine protein kinase [Paenibacillus nuruki]
MNTNNKYDPYEVKDFKYASGGNANVFLAEDKMGKKYALKTIKINSAKDAKKVKRFLNEIKVVENYQNKIKGIIPIRYKFIPEKISRDFIYTKDLNGTELWYVMDLAEPIFQKLKNWDDLKVIIDCVISLAETLEELHSHKIVHRDIKPSNLYYYEDNWAFGDFGLVSYPDSEDHKLTAKNERVGNYATIAPEMRRAGQIEDARPADVWSLAKTLWMLITKEEADGFEGSYNRTDKRLSISSYCERMPTGSLHSILEKATSYNPEDRLNIREFLDLLKKYKEELVHRQKLLTFEELKKLEEASEDGRHFRNTANSIIDTREIIELHSSQVSQEFKFEEDPEEMNILKYIKRQLEYSFTKKYYISPILKHFRNESFPAIRIFVEYTEAESKFVTALVGMDKEIHSFNTDHILNYYDKNGKIDYNLVDQFIEELDSVSMNAIY